MLSKLYNYYQITRESLFYVPAIICFFYAAGCLGAFYVDHAYADYLKDIPVVFNGEAKDAMSVAQILLSSMITLTVLVVSITMVVLNLSASQLGPRLIRIFMSDRTTKIYIGMFFGSITACFVLTGLLHEAPDEASLPRLTVSLVYLSCFANLFVLLSYVHHVARLSVADVIISKVHSELMNSINRLNKGKGEEAKRKPKGWPKDFKTKAQKVHGEKNGYVQTIDYGTLKEVAVDNTLYIEIHIMPGDYVMRGVHVASIYPKNKATPEIEKHVVDTIVHGETRTGSQDIEFSVRHLVEIGLRALSPGINDNYTAITVLNKLSAALALLFNKTISQRIYDNEDGKTVLIGKSSNEHAVIFEAFSKIRKAGEAKPDILSHMLLVIDTLKQLARTKEEKEALDEQLDFIKDHIDTHFKDTAEGRILLEKYKNVTSTK